MLISRKLLLLLTDNSLTCFGEFLMFPVRDRSAKLKCQNVASTSPSSTENFIKLDTVISYATCFVHHVLSFQLSKEPDNDVLAFNREKLLKMSFTEKLLAGLKDKDTVVRWSAAKG